MLNIICSLDENNGLGLDNGLLVSIPEDLKRFKKITIKHPILMGRKTFISLPKILPNRPHFVLSSQELKTDSELIHHFNNLDSMILGALELDKEIFFIGGGNLFSQVLPKVNRIYLTKIYKKFDCNVFFDGIDQVLEAEFNLFNEDELMDYNGLKYQFLTYDRIS